MSWKRWTKRQAGHFLFNSNWNRHTEICVCLLGRVLANSSLLELLWFWISYFIKILARKKPKNKKPNAAVLFIHYSCYLFISCLFVKMQRPPMPRKNWPESMEDLQLRVHNSTSYEMAILSGTSWLLVSAGNWCCFIIEVKNRMVF